MTAQAAVSLDMSVRVLCRDDSDSATIAHHVEFGEPDDPAALHRLADHCDVITLDHELVDTALLASLIERGVSVYPRPETLAVAIDKLALAKALREAGVPVPERIELNNKASVQDAVDILGPNLVLKTSRGGYDGRGVWFPDNLGKAEAIVEELVGQGSIVFAEALIPEPFEIAVMVVRGRDGATEVYPPVRTFQADGICVGVEAPASLSDEQTHAVERTARRTAEILDVVGVLAVEMIENDGVFTVSEVACRPHNSAHHTIDSSVTSQFENHLRAVAGLPLGSTRLVSGAGMANLLGADPAIDPRERLDQALAIEPEANVHLYMKEPRAGRKLGHVTVLDPDPAMARVRAAKVASALGGSEV